MSRRQPSACPAARNALAAFVAALDRWRTEADRVSHTDLAQIVLDESGYTAMWQADRSPDAAGRLRKSAEVGRGAMAVGSRILRRVLWSMSALVMDNAADFTGDMVNLMTPGTAPKGLEFDTVFLPGVGGRAVPEPAIDGK